jgi:Ca-activated chloride channel homolog
MPMSFASPFILWGLLLLPLAMAAYLAAQRRRTRYAVRFTNLDLLSNIAPRLPGWRRHVPAVLYLSALGALLASLARPHATVPVPRDRATVVMVMDISGSMVATDVRPDRLSAAKTAGNQFLDQLPSRFRVSLVSFSSTAQVLTLPTTDREAVRRALDGLRAEGGTAMGDAIERAIEVAQMVTDEAAAAAPSTVESPTGALPAIPSPGRQAIPRTPGAPGTPNTPNTPSADENRPPVAILLLSDGANTTGRVQPLEAAGRAQELGVPVYTIALGTAEGVVEIQDARRGTVRVRVPPDEETLRQIARTTGGEHFSAATASDLRTVYQQIGSHIGFDQVPQEVTVAFAALAAALLTAGGSLSLWWFNRFP